MAAQGAHRFALMTGQEGLAEEALNQIHDDVRHLATTCSRRPAMTWPTRTPRSPSPVPRTCAPTRPTTTGHTPGSAVCRQ